MLLATTKAGRMLNRRAGQDTRTLSRWLIAAAILVGTTAAGNAAIEVDRPVDHFPSLRDQPLTQYRAYRRMHARSEHFNQEGWLEAWTEMDARGFRYTIVSESGS